MAQLPDNFKQTIFLLADLLQDYQYAIRGTGSLVLQGLQMNVTDIDVLGDKKAALACNELLKDYLVKEVAYSESKQFKSFFGQFKISGLLVEIMGNMQIKNTKGVWSPVYDAKDRIEIKVDGKKIFVTKIEDELTAYAQMGRWNAFHKIKRQINQDRLKSAEQSRLF
jgi:hypothetical protein